MWDEFFNDLCVYTNSFIEGISGTFQELPKEKVSQLLILHFCPYGGEKTRTKQKLYHLK